MDDLIDSMETFESTPSVLEKMQILSHKNAHLTSCQLVRQDLPVTKLQDVYYHSFPSHKKSADKKKSAVACDLAHGNGRGAHLLPEGFGTAQPHNSIVPGEFRA